MQDLNLIKTLRRVDRDGKAMFDYILHATKDNGQTVETVIKHEDSSILNDLNNIVESFITKEDELEILKKTVEFMSVAKTNDGNSENTEKPDLPPNVELPKLENTDAPDLPNVANTEDPSTTDLPNLENLEKEVLSKIDESKESEEK
jgi:hypothetical protein